MVVNYPGLEFPFIRIHETKHASRQQCEGTVLGFEFTGAPDALLPDRAPSEQVAQRPLPGPTCASSSAPGARSSPGGSPTTSTSTWTTACARRSTPPRARCCPRFAACGRPRPESRAAPDGGRGRPVQGKLRVAAEPAPSAWPRSRCGPATRCWWWTTRRRRRQRRRRRAGPGAPRARAAHAGVRPQPRRRARQRRLARLLRRRRRATPRPARPLLRPAARAAHRADRRRGGGRAGATRRARRGALRLPPRGDEPGGHLRLRRVGLPEDREHRLPARGVRARSAASARRSARPRTPT